MSDMSSNRQKPKKKPEELPDGDSKTKKTQPPKPGSPMDKFNNALRKILLAPKKNTKEK